VRALDLLVWSKTEIEHSWELQGSGMREAANSTKKEGRKLLGMVESILPHGWKIGGQPFY